MSQVCCRYCLFQPGTPGGAIGRWVLQGLQGCSHEVWIFKWSLEPMDTTSRLGILMS